MEQTARVSAPVIHRAAAPPKSAQIAGIASVLLLVFSFHLWGVKVFVVGPGIQIAPWDIAGIAVVYIWINHALRYGSPAPNHVRVGIGLMLLFVMWIAFQALRSPEIGRSMTMVVQILRDFVLFVALGALVTYIRDLRTLNSLLFVLGIVIAGVSVFLFALNYDVGGAERRPFGGTILLVGSYKIPRLIGFARDPNFYALFLAISLFCGLSNNRLNLLARWSGLALITAAIALTLSRGAILAIPLAVALVSVVRAVGRSRLPSSMKRSSVRSWLAIGILGLGVFSILTVVIEPFEGWTASRMDRFLDNPRLDMWSDLTADPYVFVSGAGLRSAEARLGGRASHNSYLDILFDTGIVGLAIWVSFAIYVARKGVTLIKLDSDAVPWLQAFFGVVFMMSTLSLVFHPMFWVVSIVILARSSRVLSGSDTAS